MAAASLSIHMIIAFAVLLMPLLSAFEEQHVALQRSLKLRLCARTLWALLCVLIGVAMPFFGDVVGVVASISQVYLSFLAPPLMYIAVFKRELGVNCWGKMKLCFAWGMAISMFVCGMGLGMYASVDTLLEHLQTWGFFQRYY